MGEASCSRRETAFGSQSFHLHPGSSRSSCKSPDSERLIVWPPVVIIENTGTHFDEEQKKWMGLGKEEVRRFLQGFGDIQSGNVLPLYGPHGHRGKSIAVFAATPWGYMEAHTLTEMLARHRRGYRDWRDVARVKDRFCLGKMTADGKKILYGYLACEQDMNEVDRPKKLVKHWSMQSFVEKVLRPLNVCERETEEARKKRAKLLEEANQKLHAVEHNKKIMDMHVAQVREMSEKIEAQKRQEEELEARHEKKFEKLKRQREEEKLQRLKSFKEQERSIRQQLEQSNTAKKNVFIKYEALAQRLKDGINMEKRNHDLWIAEQENNLVLDNMNLESEMEEKLALLEKKFQDRQLKLQEEHNEQIIKFREKLSKEKENFLEEKLKELKSIEIEMERQKAKTDIQKEIAQECIICFINMVEAHLERAHFVSCGHTNICSSCAKQLWNIALKKKVRPSCPTCNALQQKKYELMPPSIYK